MKILLIALMSIVASVPEFAGQPMYCKGKGYEGYIFDSGHLVFKSIEHQQSRYTPTAMDIEKAEKLLKEKLKKVNTSRINQLDGCPVIDQKLKKYCRQYVGFIDDKGQKVIWINLFWNKQLKKQAAKEIVNVQDGCSYYWSIEINIDTGDLYNLYVNGNG
jgi:hypothetical protein